jgi:hypothetical protein
MEDRMNEAKTGGPAFPIKGPVMTSDEQGMTLRDYFAAKAMQAMVAHHGLIFSKNKQHEQDDAAGAVRAYAIADAMLKARGA